MALLGLVVAPVLHAEEHYREAHQDEDETAAQWEGGSRDPADALASALQHVHGTRRTPPAHHSHGPAGSAHGAGSLAHFALALHAPPPPPQLPSQLAVHVPPRPLTAQVRGTLAYLVPEDSQGPPPRC